MHAHGGEKRALAIALGLVAGFAAVETVAGLAAGSLALLADAAHMLSDSLALGLALFAAWLAQRPATPERSFGWRRAEVLVALANAVVLVVLGAWIVWEAIGRLSDPPEVTGGGVLAAGVAGLVVNLAAARVLHGAGSGLNVRAATLHVLADLVPGALGARPGRRRCRLPRDPPRGRRAPARAFPRHPHDAPGGARAGTH